MPHERCKLQSKLEIKLVMIFQRLYHAFNQTRTLQQSRIELFHLPAYLLDDLAISQQQVSSECQKNSVIKLSKEFVKQFKNGGRYGS